MKRLYINKSLIVISCYRLCKRLYLIIGRDNNDAYIIAYSHSDMLIGDYCEYRYSFIYGRYVLKKIKKGG